MNFTDAKIEFLGTWGKLATEWGINRTMAQIHALLLISPKPLSAEDIMAELTISRGNANMNLRELITWNLISKVLIPGERKEYFEAEKDIWEVFKRVAKERKKREIEPLIQSLNKMSLTEGDENQEEYKVFIQQINELKKFVGDADKSLETILKADENWLFSSVFKMIRK